jgi:hypothetical protein
MIAQHSTIFDGVTRAGAFVNRALDWSEFLQHVPAPHGGGGNDIFLWGDGTFTTPYIWLGSLPANLQLEVFDGVTFFDLNKPALTPGIAVALAITYDAATHTLTLYQDGVSLGTLVVDLSAITFTSTDYFLLSDTDGGDVAIPAATGWARTWQRKLTGGQVVTEGGSLSAALATNLLADTRLNNPGDLGDQSGNGHGWTVLGSLDAAPSNTIAAAATPLTLPANQSQVVDVGGLAYAVWYSYTTIAGDDDYGFRFWADNLAFNSFETEVFLGPLGAPVDYLGGYFADDKPIVVPAPVPLVTPPTPGTLILFHITPVSSTPPNVKLNITGQRAPTTPTIAGQIFIGEFGFDGDAVLLDQATGAITGYRRLLGPNDQGDLLPGAVFAVDNGDTLNVDVWSASTNPFFHIGSVAGSMSGSFNSIRSDRLNTFYFAHSTNAVAATVKTVSRTAGLGGTTWTLPANSKSLRGIAPSRDGTILYYMQLVAGFAVHRFDLIGNAPLSDLVAGVGTTTPVKDLIVCLDGSVLVPYHETNTIVRYSAAGATIQSYVIPDALDRFFLDIDELHFWAWSQIGGINSQFRKIRLADGVVISTTPTVPIFNDGILAAAAGAVAPVFGNSNSCPLLVFESAPTPPPTTCDCFTTIVIGVGGSPGTTLGSNVVPIGSGIEIGDIDMLFGEQRFIIPHQQVNVSGAAQGFNFGVVDDEAMGLMIVTTNGDPIRWLVSGETPTGTDGNVAPGGTVFVIANITNAKNFKFVLDGASAAAQVCANFSRP